MPHKYKAEKVAPLDVRLSALKDELKAAAADPEASGLRTSHYSAVESAIRGLEASIEQEGQLNRDWVREPG